MRDQRFRKCMKDCQNLETTRQLLIYHASFAEGVDGPFHAIVPELLEEREKLLQSAIDELRTKARDVQARCEKLWKTHPETQTDFCRMLQRTEAGANSVDDELDPRVHAAFKYAVRHPHLNEDLWKKKGKEEEDDKGDGNELDRTIMMIKTGVNSAHGLGALLKEITNRHRVKRFLHSIVDALHKKKVCCDLTGELVERSRLVVLPCGHKGSAAALRPKVKAQGRCAIVGCCQQNITEKEVLEIDKLTKSVLHGCTSADDDIHTKKVVGPFGSKMSAIVRSVKPILRRDSTSRILIFCQLAPLMSKLQDALNMAEIKHQLLEGSPQEMFDQMQAFSCAKGAATRTLLVPLDERCAGSNLTAANHVMFLHPVLKHDTRSPADIERQAIGRARRFGQSREVHVWRFVTTKTIEEHIERKNQMERRD